MCVCVTEGVLHEVFSHHRLCLQKKALVDAAVVSGGIVFEAPEGVQVAANKQGDASMYTTVCLPFLPRVYHVRRRGDYPTKLFQSRVCLCAQWTGAAARVEQRRRER